MVTFPDKISPCVGATGTLKKKKKKKCQSTKTLL